MPDLDSSDPCSITSYVPANATRQANLPATDFNLIALAPWHSTSCTLSYLASTRYDPIRAFIFYLPDNGTDVPLSTDPAWNLNDGGVWKANAHYPVYAVPGFVGAQFMTALSQYSGNVTAAPNGRELINLGVYPSEYVRVMTEIAITSNTSLPSLWIFLLVVLGVLAIVLGTTLVTMHLLQGQRRKDLERRVMKGQVDLEALGIKRLTVPIAVIEAMPLFVYVNHSRATSIKEQPRKSLESDLESQLDVEGSTSDPSTIYRVKEATIVSTYERSSYDLATDLGSFKPDSQPACSICLDGFEPGITVIRELRCGHIFHPECIDTFLSEISSLCPLCKKSVFPLGYCPVPISNKMVRRERAIRRLRAHITVSEYGTEAERTWLQIQSAARMVTHMDHEPQPPGTARLSHRVRKSDVEAAQGSDTTVLGRPDSSNRQDITRQRAHELAGDMPFTAGDGRAAWRRALAKTFPT